VIADAKRRAVVVDDFAEVELEPRGAGAVGGAWSAVSVQVPKLDLRTEVVGRFEQL